MMTAGMAGLILINAISHTVASIAGGGEYNSGLFSAFVLFWPITLWTFYACFGKGKLKYSALLVVILIGVIGHGVLAGSVGLYAQNLIGDYGAAVIQVLNAVLMVSLWYAVGKIRGGKLAEVRNI